MGRTLLGFALFVVLGFGAGVGLGWLMSRWHVSFGEITGKWYMLLAVLGGAAAAVYAQVVIHEGGHWLFGLLSGYGFVSFRVGSWMWIKEGERIRFRRQPLAGTLGQCLMSPPDVAYEHLPYVWYNLGGAVANLLASLVLLAVVILCPLPFAAALILLVGAVVGLAFALLNGIPLRLAAVDNDGRNVLSMWDNLDARRAFVLQLRMAERLSRGERLKDMPTEWFVCPPDAAMHNGLVAALAVFAANRLMDEHAFKQADQLMAHLLSIPSAMAGVHRGLLTGDRIFLTLVSLARPQCAEQLLTKEQRQFMQSMKRFISVLRTQYALALLHEKDGQKAQRLLKQFEKAANRHPYAGEAEAERALVSMATDAANQPQAPLHEF